MDKKLLLSKSMTGAFAVLTIALTVLGPLLVDLVCGWYAIPRNTLGNILLVSGYICSALALVTLYEIFGLLAAISKGEVFTAANVRRIRMMSLLCALAGVVTMIDGVVTRLFFLGTIGLAALFMALLVRVVGDAFETARRMKGELDLTI